MAERTAEGTTGLSVVIVNYNGRGFVEAAVASAFSCDTGVLEVVLVDNASTDQSAEEVAAAFPTVRILRFAENRGFAEGANAGYRAATTPLVLFLNSDARLAPHSVEQIAAEFQNDPSLVCVTTAVHNEGEPEDSHRGATYSVFGSRIPSVWDDPARVWGPSGAAFALHRHRFPEEVPFPAHFFAYYEDFVLGSTLRHRRLCIRKVPSVVVPHLGSLTASRLSRSRIRFLQERNRVASLVATYSSTTLAKLLPLYILDLVLRLFYSASGGGLLGFLAAQLHLVLSPLALARLRRAVRGSFPVADMDLLPYLSGKLHARGRLLNRLSLAYLRLVRLPVAELSSDGQVTAH
jgi:GT2 family glycosyltransferase